MVVFDENRIEQPDTVVGPVAGPDCVLFENAKRWCRFSRVEYHDLAASCIDELARFRGDARQSLEKIESRTFTNEQRPRRTDNCGDLFSWFNGVTVVPPTVRVDLAME